MPSAPQLPLVGTARQVKERTEGTDPPEYIWTFRLEGNDAKGNLLPPISVEMRGGRFDGELNDGDSVSVDGKWRKGILVSKRAFNQTTDSWFGPSAAYTAAKQIVSVLFLAGFIAIVVFVYLMWHHRPSPPASPAAFPVPISDLAPTGVFKGAIRYSAIQRFSYGSPIQVNRPL